MNDSQPAAMTDQIRDAIRDALIETRERLDDEHPGYDANQIRAGIDAAMKWLDSQPTAARQGE